MSGNDFIIGCIGVGLLILCASLFLADSCESIAKAIRERHK